ncbi:hypothetical protein FM104_15680 [Microbacterium esteraromaticum]|uniref:Uncharacterized protein n=1 Tax=Microbacterium esteraromaticum TaxID=57043 RepID=A0A1R4KS88_9MICO|nr:hypothetical protein FM104_15680 [Microbacterium esteraromaticum]
MAVSQRSSKQPHDDVRRHDEAGQQGGQVRSPRALIDRHGQRDSGDRPGDPDAGARHEQRAELEASHHSRHIENDTHYQ